MVFADPAEGFPATCGQTLLRAAFFRPFSQMNRIHSPLLLILTLAGLLLAGFLLAGCAEERAQDCSRDADCGGSQFCVDAVCVEECAHDEECMGNTYCEVYQRQGTVDPIQVCLDEFSASNGGVGCETDSQCREILRDPAARCGIHQRCVLTPETTTNGNQASNQAHPDGNSTEEPGNQDAEPLPIARQLLVIEQLNDDGSVYGAYQEEIAGDDDDSSPEDQGRQGRTKDDDENDENDDVDRPPTSPVRLGAVVVRDQALELVGFGQVLLLEPPGTDVLPSDLMAAPISLDYDGTCLEEPSSRPYTSLGGPGGRAIIEIFDRHQTHLELVESWRLQIIAAGPTCPIGPPADLVADDPGDEYHGAYRVLLCDVEDGLVLPEPDDCFELDGPLKNYSDLEVTTGL